MGENMLVGEVYKDGEHLKLVNVILGDTVGYRFLNKDKLYGVSTPIPTDWELVKSAKMKKKGRIKGLKIGDVLKCPRRGYIYEVVDMESERNFKVRCLYGSTWGMERGDFWMLNDHFNFEKL
jgi:hypothetical protein